MLIEVDSMLIFWWTVLFFFFTNVCTWYRTQYMFYRPNLKHRSVEFLSFYSLAYKLSIPWIVYVSLGGKSSCCYFPGASVHVYFAIFAQGRLCLCAVARSFNFPVLWSLGVALEYWFLFESSLVATSADVILLSAVNIEKPLNLRSRSALISCPGFWV